MITALGTLQDNGFDDEFIADDLKEDPAESQLLDFAKDEDDENYVFPNIENLTTERQQRTILKALIAAFTNMAIEEEPNKLPDPKTFFNFDKALLKRVEDIYSRQCPKICDQDKEKKDSNLKRLFAVQRQHKFPYLQLLCSSFGRWCVQRTNDKEPDASVENWMKECRHFDQFTNQQHAQFVGDGLKDFLNRIAPRLMLEFSALVFISFFMCFICKIANDCDPKTRCCIHYRDQQVFIQDYLRATVEYLTGAALWVKNMASDSKTETCPFQLDLVIAYPKVRHVQEDDDDDKEEDQDENSQGPIMESYSYFGDIQQRLKANNLSFGQTNAVSSNEMNNIRLVYEDLRKQIGGKELFSKKRFVAYVDRGVRFTNKNQQNKPETGYDGEDEMLMFHPPKEVADIPPDAVPEWGFEALKTCVIPSTTYEEEQTEINGMDQKENDNPTVTAYGSIREHTNAQMIIFSFQVTQSDSIRCWMFVNGQAIRFMPEDVKTTLPLFFDQEKIENEDWKENERYAQSKDIANARDQLEKSLIDPQYDEFKKLYINAQTAQ